MHAVLNRLTLIAMVAFSAISTDFYLPAVPSIVADLGATDAQGQFTLGIFMLGLAFGQLVYGPLSDHYGRKPVLYVGLVLYILSSLACAISASIEQLLLARLFQALAAACGPVLARAIVADSYGPREAAKVMATLAASMALLPTVAPVLGGWLLIWFEWRVHFYVLALFGVVVYVSALSLRESGPAVNAGRLSFSRIGKQFIVALKDPVFVGYTVVGSALFAAMFTWITTSSFIVINQFGLAPEQFGYTFSLVVVGYLLGAFVSSRLVLRFGIIKMLALGVKLGIVAAVLMLCLALLKIESLALVLVAIFGLFMASGITLANAQMGAVSALPKAAGQASSVFGFFQTGVAAVGSMLVGHLYNGTLLPLALAMSMLVALSAITFFTFLKKQMNLNDE